LDEIKEVLTGRQVDALELVSKVGHPEDKVIRVLRWLPDHNKLVMNDKHLLSWREADFFSS